MSGLKSTSTFQMKADSLIVLLHYLLYPSRNAYHNSIGDKIHDELYINGFIDKKSDGGANWMLTPNGENYLKRVLQVSFVPEELIEAERQDNFLSLSGSKIPLLYRFSNYLIFYRGGPANIFSWTFYLKHFAVRNICVYLSQRSTKRYAALQIISDLFVQVNWET